MERKGNLLSVRTDVRVLDATIRDGGLVNDFFFPDEFIRDLYQTNIKAGVDYMEFGYKALASGSSVTTRTFALWWARTTLS